MRLIPILLLCLLPSFAAAQPTHPVQLLHTFRPSPIRPNGGLVQTPDGSFYGVTRYGIVRLSPSGEVTAVAHFSDGSALGPLVRASDGALYGATFAGGPANHGTIFRFDPAAGGLRTVHAFASPSEGAGPLGGLVQVGGSLYGVTQNGPGSVGGSGGGAGTVFRIVVATGEFVTDASFSSATLGSPARPPTLGADGRLYGATNGNELYAFDPVTRGLTRVQSLLFAQGSLPKSLTLGADGRLYGNATFGGAEGDVGMGTIFRYSPVTNSVELVYSLAPSNGVDGRRPGPLLAATDGHFYGVTDRQDDDNQAGTLFRLRAGVGGTFTYETLREFAAASDGSLTDSVLTQGADGLIYGYAIGGGPNSGGTLFRFDPLAGGPPGNPIAFTVLHTFPCVTTWYPSAAPTPAADGFLYGTTNYCGDTYRGMVYRLAPATGTLTLLGVVPGDLGNAINSALVQGPDGRLYGTSRRYTTAEVTSIIRVDPSTGAATVAVGDVNPPAPASVSPGLVRTPAGQMFGVRGESSSTVVYRFDPVTNAVPAVAQIPASLSRLIARSNGDVVAFARYLTPPTDSLARETLVRLNPAAPSGYDEVPLRLGFVVGTAVEGADGNLYLASSTAPAVVRRMHPVTGALSAACVVPLAGVANHLSVASDGALHGVVVHDVAQRLFRCDPATGAVTLTTLPSSIGYLVGPMTRVGSLFYGASYVRPGLQVDERDGGTLFQVATPGATLPAIDTDGDSLPNAWETAYGLDPFAGGGGNGPADDPDRDGRTNAQELADGSHPRGVVTRLFAEGASNAFFRTRFDLANASITEGAIVRARFLTDTGATVATDLHLPPWAHLGLDPSTVPGMPQGSFSAIFESDMPMAVDRSMSWDASGYGSHLETGIAAPSMTWYFAEGSTSGDFSLFYLLQNPQTAAVTATVRYLRPSGQVPIDRTYTLPPASRTTIVVDAQGSELASTDVSAVITATAPIVAERSMYVNRPGQPFAAGHESAGVTTPALDWFLAEGATGAFFDLFVLISNPSPTAATIAVEYLRSSGPPLTKTYQVPAQSRMTIWVDDEQLPAGSGQKPLAQGSVSTAVHVTNGVPVIVERAMWWPGPETTSNFWYEAHNSPGATSAATRWLIGGAEIFGDDAPDTYVLIANTSDRAGEARLYLMTDDGADTQYTLTSPTLAPKSRTTVNLRTYLPSSFPARWVGVLVESSGNDPVPIVVERATYASPGGVFWGRGGNALATPIP